MTNRIALRQLKILEKVDKIERNNMANLPLGFQAYSVQELKERLPLISKNKRKLLCIVKDNIPKFAQLDKNYRQTYSFQEKAKVKSLGLKCVK